MANLISTAERAAYKQAIDDIHDTFKLPITVWKKSAQEITNTQTDYDAFSDAGVQNITYTSVYQNFYARIKYIDRQEKEFGLALADASIRTNASIDVTQEFNLVRLKVDEETKNYMKDCERVIIEGDDLEYIPITVPRPHGVFESTYYTIYCKSLV